MTSSTGKPQYIARRALTLLLAVVIILSAFGGCNRKDPADDVTLTWPERSEEGREGKEFIYRW